MCSDTIVARDVRKLLQKIPASYISQVLLQMNENFSFARFVKKKL